MKSLFYHAVCLSGATTLLLAGCGTPNRASSSPVFATNEISTLTESNTGQTVPFSPRTNFHIELTSNRTTGYSWQLARNDDGVLEDMKPSYVEDDRAPGMVGVGGKEIFPFKTLKKGTTTIRLTYRRPWKGGEVGQRVEFKIIVH